MRINNNSIDFQQIAEQMAEATPATTSTKTADPAGPSFADELASFVNEVSAQQDTAEFESQKLAAGQGNVHETALALEKADIEMRLLMKGRNKIIEAYQEISRMPI